MSERVRQLRATVEELRLGFAPKATRFSAAFREQVIALAREERAAGAPLVQIASEVGLHARTIGRWLRGTSNTGGTAPKRHFRRVTVAPERILPLERQVRQMRHEGLAIDSQTLWDQVEALARRLTPVCDALNARVLVAPVLGADETWWRLMQGRGSKRWWAWTLASPDAVVYRILDSRSQEAARQVLGEYRGVVVADGYGAYDVLARAGPESRFSLAHCWAHARR